MVAAKPRAVSHIDPTTSTSASSSAPLPPPSATPKPKRTTARRTISLGGIKNSIKSAWTKIRRMAERPLEAIKRATKAADRAPHLRKKNIARTDPIDVLDDTGLGAYHHDGPYDATLASRNNDKRYAPVEAVKYGNSEALKATPRENVVDSLERHVPLQGTASIPPGHRDMSGRVMQYEEGADLMREEDAPGGAYRRWDHVVSYLTAYLCTQQNIFILNLFKYETFANTLHRSTIPTISKARVNHTTPSKSSERSENVSSRNLPPSTMAPTRCNQPAALPAFTLRTTMP